MLRPSKVCKIFRPNWLVFDIVSVYSPPSRRGSLDFIRVTSSSFLLSSFLLSSSSSPFFLPTALDLSGHCRTSTASSGSQCNRKLQIAVGTAGPNRELQISVEVRQCGARG